MFYIYDSTLDYIFISSNIVVKDAFLVPRPVGYNQNKTEIGEIVVVVPESQRHLKSEISAELDFEVSTPQPSSLWPSDHFMIITNLEL